MLVRIPIASFIVGLFTACRPTGGDDPGLGDTDPPDTVDEDGDGFSVDTDCDDTNAAINPDADEVCDNLDNDCDGDIDVEDADLVDGVTFFADVDGDGFGGALVTACERPEGHVENDDDCDDANADINPDAIELCDGIDNDCDAATAEAGLATFFGEAGPVDFTASLTGTADAPVALTLDEPGVLNICEGTWFVNLDIRADVALIGPAGPVLTLLDGAQAGRVLDVGTPAASVQLRGLTIQNGDAGDDYGDGGGVRVDNGVVLNGEDLVFRDNRGLLGGALGVLGGAQVILQNTLMVGNFASTGGAFQVRGSGSSVTLESTTLRENEAISAGAIMVFEGSAACVSSQLFGNDGGAYDAAVYILGGVATFDNCDFVDAATNVGNTPADIYFRNAATLTNVGLGFTANCDRFGCTP